MDEQKIDPIGAALKEIQAIKSDTAPIPDRVGKLNRIMIDLMKLMVNSGDSDVVFAKKIHAPLWEVYRKVGLYSMSDIKSMVKK